MVELLAFLFASGLGFGLSCWIFGSILQKSNSHGDSHGSKLDYGVNVHFTSRKDHMSNNERDTYTRWYANPILDTAAPSGTQRVRRLSDVELKEFKAASAANNFKANPRVEDDMTNDGILDNEDEFQRWENEQEAAGAPSAFKPLNPQQ